MELIPGLNDDMANECLIRVPFDSFPLITLTCKSWKTRIYQPEFSRLRLTAGKSQHVFIMTQAKVNPSMTTFGASKYSPVPVYRLTLHDTDKSIWRELPAIPDFPAGLPIFCQVIRIGSGLVLLGGWNPKTFEVSTAVYLFDFLTATWRSGADMPGVRRSLFGCASDSDRTVYVAGGHDQDKNALRSVLMYDVVNDMWTPLADMAKERDECKAVFLRGKLHVISGYCTNRQGRFENTSETLDLATWQWDQVNGDFIYSPIVSACVAADNEGKLYACQGSNVVVRDNDTWKVVSELPSDVRNTTRMMPWKKKLCVIGSGKLGGTHVSYVLDLRSYKWTQTVVPEGFSGHVHSCCHVEL